MAINHWPEEQRPRERLIRHGAQQLSDAELLAVFLRVGVSGKSAVDLGRDMLKHFGSLHAMFAASLSDFCIVNGLGRRNMRRCRLFWNWRDVPSPNN